MRKSKKGAATKDAQYGFSASELDEKKEQFEEKWNNKKKAPRLQEDDLTIMRTLGTGSFGRVMLTKDKYDNYFATKETDKSAGGIMTIVIHVLKKRKVTQRVPRLAGNVKIIF